MVAEIQSVKQYGQSNTFHEDREEDSLKRMKSHFSDFYACVNMQEDINFAGFSIKGQV